MVHESPRAILANEEIGRRQETIADRFAAGHERGVTDDMCYWVEAGHTAAAAL